MKSFAAISEHNQYLKSLMWQKVKTKVYSDAVQCFWHCGPQKIVSLKLRAIPVNLKATT